MAELRQNPFKEVVNKCPEDDRLTEDMHDKMTSTTFLPTGFPPTDRKQAERTLPQKNLHQLANLPHAKSVIRY